MFKNTTGKDHKETEMKKDCDVIIIGGGLGGLISAAFLSKKGLYVKLFEKQQNVGGVLGTFQRKKYWFEASTHQIASFNFMDKIYGMLGAKKPCIVKSKNLFDAIYYDGTSSIEKYTLPANLSQLKKTLIGYFPADRENISGFIRSSIRISSDSYRLKNLQVSENILPHLFDAITASMLQKGKEGSFIKKIGMLSYNNLIKNMDRSFYDMIRPFDKKLKSLISQYWMYFSTDVYKAPGIIFLISLYFFASRSPFVFKNGTRELVDNLADAIWKNKGIIQCNTEVKNILVDNNSVLGIVTDTGKTCYADHVISAINTHDVFFNMIGEDKIPPQYADLIRNLEYSMSSFQVFIGLPEPLEHYGFEFNSETVFFNFSYDLKEIDDSISPGADTQFLMTNYSRLNRQLSGENKTSIALIEFDRYKRWEELNDTEYAKLKEETQALMLDKFKKVTGIDAAKEAEIIFSSTPRTYKRYSSNRFGEIMGLQNILGKPKTPVHTSFENLFLAGAYAGPGGGINGVMEGGIKAAKAVLKNSKR